MSNTFTLDAVVRTDLGKGASRRLRRANKVPAVLYGAGEPVSLTFEHKEVIKAQESEAFYSSVLTLNIDGKPTQAIIKDMQRHPYKPVVMHMDFQRVDMNQKLHTTVPVHFINEEAAVKEHGGVVSHNISELEITCLPADLPEFIEVDVAKCELGATLHLSDITLPAGVESVELNKGESHDQAVVTIAKGRKGGDEDEAEAGEGEEGAAE